MTSLGAIHLGIRQPIHATNLQLSGSSTTLLTLAPVVDDHFDDSDYCSSDEEPQHDQQPNRRYLSPTGHGDYDPNASSTTLSVSLSDLSSQSNTSTLPNPRYPRHAQLSPNVSRLSSMLRSHNDGGSKSKKSSCMGIHHALKLSFLGTLGPGIPITPTPSVFGEGMNGFITNDPSNPGGLFGYSPEEEKRLVRKIDWRIIPILGIFYAISNLNRVNLLNARLFAFESALHISAEQYSWVVALFYVGYGLAEIPSNLVLLYLTPRVWLPASMFMWGCITFLLAWARDLQMLLIGRFFLGVAEAALIPGVLVYISMFYKKSEQTFRMAILQAFSSAAGAAGGFLLTESPESAPWLNQRETSIAVYRIRNDTKIKVSKKISKQNIIAAVKDRKVYIFMAINMCIAITMVSSTGVNSRAWMGLAKAIKGQNQGPATPIGHLHGHLNTAVESVITQEPTHDARMLAQLLSTPIYVIGAISSFCAALIADRMQQRGIILMILALVMIAGYLMQLLTLNVYVNYVGVMALSIGQTPITPIVSSWLTTNFGGYAKRVIAVAMFLLSSSIGGIIGSQLYKTRDGPRYTALQRFLLKRENNRRNYSVSFGINPLKFFSKAELRDLSDKYPAFRYTL
ncbi:hypothetical protein BGZ80_008637 [Entomortierella chlamydospora]|uniref:Major facilitator superfamily (MFS) profile domain-containing protein n=1 Tax=Entomortierella chlamydospora TaxID=101097 RepID=A0A9P6MXZ2_9FUNG|nr:hypothetical protein BGZ80_008637 [Entomortierella chlamydospora]